MDGTVVITSAQTAGRGQRGNTWESEPGKNLTFSLILKPPFLPVQAQFQINRVLSLGLAEYFQSKTDKDVRIKWPNDILIGEKKVCGILIENHLSGNQIQCSIAGMGVNINQENFGSPKASSLRVATGIEYSLSDELELLMGFIEVRYTALRNNAYDALERDYLALLYRRNEMHWFSAGESQFEGIITGVDDLGRLRLRTATEEKVFGVKEIGFL